MKKIFIYPALATICIASLFSCQSDADFLKEQPKSQFSIDNAYQSADQVISTIVCGYAVLKTLNFATFNAQQTDESATFSAFGGQNSTIHNWNSSQGKSRWDNLYKIIAYSNQALYASELESITWSSSEQKTQIQAEARALRGYAYLRLAEYFGGVPLQKEYSETLRFDYQRASRAETYQFAIDDLEYAFDNLPENQNIGRITKGAAALMASEAYLGLGVDQNNTSYYTSAATWAQKCIDRHPLMKERFGVRANPSDKGSNLGVPNYNPDGTPYSDLFYKQNPRLANNTEAVWVMLGAENFAEYSANSSALNVTNPSLGTGFAPALRDCKLASAEGIAPWPEGGASAFYQGPNGACAVPAIAANFVPFGGVISWFSAVQVFDEEHNKGDWDDRDKEGVAIRRYYPVTNPQHPDYGVEVYWGTDPGMKGWEHIDKTNPTTAMEYFPIFDKLVPVDAWGYDENYYYSASVWGTTIFRDYYMYRSAEAYLLLAEAKFRAGDVEAAATAINAVRNRANATPFTASDMSLQSILDERCRELMCEEDRWATFLRQEPSVWKDRIYSYGVWIYDPTLSSLNKNAESVSLYPVGQQFAYGNPGSQIKWDLWPIPKDYVDLNTDNPEGMAQNPGWE